MLSNVEKLLNTTAALYPPQRLYSISCNIIRYTVWRFLLGLTRREKIRNQLIRRTSEVKWFGDKVRETSVRWFVHVQKYIEEKMLNMELHRWVLTLFEGAQVTPNFIRASLKITINSINNSAFLYYFLELSSNVIFILIKCLLIFICSLNSIG